LDWSKKVELFEQIRRKYEFGIGTIARVAPKLKVQRCRAGTAASMRAGRHQRFPRACSPAAGP